MSTSATPAGSEVWGTWPVSNTRSVDPGSEPELSFWWL